VESPALMVTISFIRLIEEQSGEMLFKFVSFIVTTTKKTVRVKNYRSSRNYVEFVASSRNYAISRAILARLESCNKWEYCCTRYREQLDVLIVVIDSL
jgi:hypothetical protein